jgi:hypothetical protein
MAAILAWTAFLDAVAKVPGGGKGVPGKGHIWALD